VPQHRRFHAHRSIAASRSVVCLGEFECLSVWYIQGGARDEHRGAQSLDLHSGFNILKRCILDEVGKPSDLVLSHPPVSQHRRLQRQCVGQGGAS
jgi:hypothetical protein